MKTLKISFASLLIISVTLFSLTACGGGGDDPPPPPPSGGNQDDDPVVVPDPSAATLVAPANNTECNTGVIDPNNNAFSTVTFEWNASQTQIDIRNHYKFDY